jgi:FPC/CPF motif-containing protein YcgG
MARLLRSDGRSLISESPLPDWVGEAYSDFKLLLLDPDPPFPCHFGVIAEQQGHLRYTYLEEQETHQAEPLAGALRTYLDEYPLIPSRSALIVFARAGDSITTLPQYEEAFWRVLQSLHDNDSEPWPENIPTDPEDPAWEFCFAGQPIFITGHAPPYEQRRSRSSKGPLMLVIQSRANLHGIVGKGASAEAVRQRIRGAVRVYDGIEPSPDLGIFGNPDVREWKQYWLTDSNESLSRVCPLTIVRKI